MQIEFTKMHGAGNDFVMIENLDGKLQLSAEQVAHLCDRRFGIGADGLILLNPPGSEDTQASMVYYNADGGRVDMCGNGARCFTSFAIANSVGDGSSLTFLTDAGKMTARANAGEYTISMTPVAGLELDKSLSTEHGDYTYHFLNTGVEHAVIFTDALSEIRIQEEGSALRYHEAFAPAGTNANFASARPDGSLKVRTYERGVEGETLACGTGVCAAAIAGALKGMTSAPVSVEVAGGDTLTVDFEADGQRIQNLTLTGPAKVVYTGTVAL